MTRWLLLLCLLGPLGCRSATSDPGPLSSLWGGEREATPLGSNSNDVVAALQERRTRQESNWARKLWEPVQERLGEATTVASPDELQGDRLSLDVESKPTPLLYCGVASFAERQGNLNQAREFYEKAVALDRKHLESRLGLARVAMRQGELAVAADHYASALASHPDSPAAHNDWGLFLQAQGRDDEARSSLERAVRIAPDNRRYRNNLAALLVAEGRPEVAEIVLRELTDSVTADITIAEFAERQGAMEWAEGYRQRARAEAVTLPADHAAHRYFAQRDAMSR